MDSSAIYTTARNLVEKIKAEKPGHFAEKGSTFCLIKSDDGRLFSAVSGIKAVSENEIAPVAAESIAINSMLAECAPKAVEMVVVADSLKVCKPEKECLERLISLDADNAKCSVAITAVEAVEAGAVNYDAVEEIKEESLGSPADFSDGFDFIGVSVKSYYRWLF